MLCMFSNFTDAKTIYNSITHYSANQSSYFKTSFNVGLVGISIQYKG